MKKKTLNPLYFSTLYLIHFLFIFNDLKSYGAPCESSLKFKENGEMTKELEFQESICSYVLKPKN
jgi:hypothetical protein